MWEFQTVEIKQAMKYIGSEECLEEVLVPYCGRLIVKNILNYSPPGMGLFKIPPSKWWTYLTILEDVLAL